MKREQTDFLVHWNNMSWVLGSLILQSYKTEWICVSLWNMK